MSAYNDGNAPFGSQVITIGATAYVAEKISYTEPSTIVERRDEDGDPSAQVFVNGFGSGTAELQFATTLTVIPAVGATFTLTRQGGATAGTIGAIVSEVGEAYGQLEIKKCSVNFRRRYN
jgi:hypothetical protein